MKAYGRGRKKRDETQKRKNEWLIDGKMHCVRLSRRMK